MGIFKLNGIDYMGGGGGGNANEQVLTWNEYCALTEEEKTNGTTYYINDINGVGKDQFQPIIYSEEEREIGVWIDGKPLYEKTFNATSGSINNYNELDLGISSDSISMIKIKSCFIRNTFSGFNGVYHLGPYTTPADQQFLGGLNPKSNGNCVLFYRVGPYCAGGDLTLTVQYTKAVDTAGSGTWTPQGVPAVHYSTDEHVVGTWIDGSTIYERTVEIINSFSSSYPYDISSFSNGILDFEGYYICTTNNSTYRIPLNYYEDETYHTYTGYNVTTNKMFLKVYGFTGQKAILTIRYTKSSS